MVDEVPFIFSDLTLSRRLEKAEARGSVDFVEARAVVEPGSGSQRNAERHGFRIAYTRIKWRSKAVGSL